MGSMTIWEIEQELLAVVGRPVRDSAGKIQGYACEGPVMDAVKRLAPVILRMMERACLYGYTGRVSNQTRVEDTQSRWPDPTHESSSCPPP